MAQYLTKYPDFNAREFNAEWVQGISSFSLLPEISRGSPTCGGRPVPRRRGPHPPRLRQPPPPTWKVDAAAEIFLSAAGGRKGRLTGQLPHLAVPRRRRRRPRPLGRREGEAPPGGGLCGLTGQYGPDCPFWGIRLVVPSRRLTASLAVPYREIF